MSFEYLVDPGKGPQWKGVLPGKPAPYVLRRGQGEHRSCSPTCSRCSCPATRPTGSSASSPPRARRQHHPDPLAQRTHETFYILEGKVRLFFEDAAGTQTDRAARPRRLRLRARRNAARLPRRGGGPAHRAR